MDPVRIVYVGLAAVLALAIWFVFETRNPNKPDSPPLRTRRDELIEARNKIRHQMRILREPARGSDYTGYSRDAMRKLTEALEAVEEELKNSSTR